MTRGTGYKANKWTICVMVVVCGVFLFLCAQQIYWRLTTHEQTAIMPAMTPMTPRPSAPVLTIPSMHRTITPVHSSPVVTGSLLFTSRPATETTYTIHTTSGAQVHSIGGGSSNGIGLATSQRSTGSRGIAYSASASTIPMIAMSYSAGRIESQTADLQHFRPHARGIQANGDGSYDGEIKSEGGYTYYWDEASETWVLSMPVGTTKTEGGITYMWNGSAWEVVTGTDPVSAVPVGNIPWWFFIILASIYGIAKSVREIYGSNVGEMS